MSISDRLGETTERAARVIGSVMSRWDMDGRPDVDGGIDTLIARALAEAGLLAPAPLDPVRRILDRLADTTEPPCDHTTWIEAQRQAIHDISVYVYPEADQ